MFTLRDDVLTHNQNYDEDKGFCFIGRCDGQGDIFGHKRNFQVGVEPAKGMGVSFVLECGDKGDSAMKIREEEEIPEMVLSDEGREFGTIVKWIEDKGFGYVQRKKGGEEYVDFFLRFLALLNERTLLTPTLRIEHTSTPVLAMISPLRKACASPSSLKKTTRVLPPRTSAKRIQSESLVLLLSVVMALLTYAASCTHYSLSTAMLTNCIVLCRSSS